jgi:hypothetical protein
MIQEILDRIETFKSIPELPMLSVRQRSCRLELLRCRIVGLVTVYGSVRFSHTT